MSLEGIPLIDQLVLPAFAHLLGILALAQVGPNPNQRVEDHDAQLRRHSRCVSGTEVSLNGQQYVSNGTITYTYYADATPSPASSGWAYSGSTSIVVGSSLSGRLRLRCRFVGEGSGATRTTGLYDSDASMQFFSGSSAQSHLPMVGDEHLYILNGQQYAPVALNFTVHSPYVMG